MKIVYECEICKARYSVRGDAEKCEAKGVKQKYKEGERVLRGSGARADIVIIDEVSIAPWTHCFIYKVSLDPDDNPGRILLSLGWLSEKDLHPLAPATQ